MTKENAKKLPRFKSLDELVRYFDTHDLGDELEALPEARFDLELKRGKHLFALDEEIAGKLAKIARKKKISSQELIDSWLREKIRETV